VTTLDRARDAAPVDMLEAKAATGARTRARGALGDGVLNATPNEGINGPSPIEALLAALVGCVARNLRSVAQSAHVQLERLLMRVATGRSDDPPAITALRRGLAITTEMPVDRTRRPLELALRDATIARTLAPGLDLTMLLTINDSPVETHHVA
jgi:uncharacterized OsmC-like protein